MKYLVILFILFPMLVSGATSYTDPKCNNKCKDGQCVASTEDGKYYCITKPPVTQDNYFHDAVLKEGHPIIICNSKTPLDDPNHPLIECINAREIRIRSNLMALYNKGWKLIQILKTNNGYLYYLDRK